MNKNMRLLSTKLLFILVCCTLLFSGCGPEPQPMDEAIDQAEDNAVETATEPAAIPPVVVPEEPAEDIPIRELTEEERRLISLEAEKIIILIGLTGGISDDLRFLRETYPDIEFIDVESGLSGENHRREIWYSEATNFSYHIYHWFYDKDGIWKNELQCISGEVGDIISGLAVVVETSELMDALGIPESDWAVGEAPKEPANYCMYNGVYALRDDTAPDDIVIIVPDAFNPEKRFPDAIRITPKRPGFISPTDKVEIQHVREGM